MSSDHQPWLPAGVECVERRPSPAFGELFVVEDRRLDSALPVRRLLLQIKTEGAELAKKFLERLQQLAGVSASHLMLPLEIWRPDAAIVEILEANQSPSLIIKNEKGAGHSTEKVDELIRQLLVGLAGLHTHGIVHGDVRPENVFVDESRGGSISVWLGNSAVGTLSWLSHGATRDPRSRDYFPWHWQGQTREASTAADLYALGLTILELVAGSGANFVRHRGTVESGDKEQAKLRIPRDAGLSANGRILVGRLVSQNDELRFSDALQAQAWWEREQSRPRKRYPYLVAIALTSAVVALLSFGWIMAARGRISRLTLENGKLQLERASLERRLLGAEIEEKLEKRLQGLDAQIASVGEQTKGTALLHQRLEDSLENADGNFSLLRQQLAELLKKPTGPLPGADKPPKAHTEADQEEQARQEALAFWKKNSTPEAVKVRLNYDELHSVQKRIASALKDASLSKLAETQISKWHAALLKLLGTPRASGWLAHDSDARSMAAKFIQDPAARTIPDPTINHAEACQARLQALNAAAKQWLLWASDDKLTLQEVKSVELPSLPNDETSRILKQWVLETSNTTEGVIEFESEFNTVDWGVARFIYVDGHSGAPLTQTRPIATGDHRFPPGTAARFQWPTNGQFRIVDTSGSLYGRLGGYKNICEFTFRGPFPVWRAYYSGQIGDDKEYLQFDIPKCPGPPRENLLPQAVASHSGAATAEVPSTKK